MKLQPLTPLLKIAFSKERVVSYSDFEDLDKIKVSHHGLMHHSASDESHAAGSVILGTGDSFSKAQTRFGKRQVVAHTYR